MKSKKKKKAKIVLPSPTLYRPKGAVKTLFVGLLDGWRAVPMTYDYGDHAQHVYEYILAPNNRVYRNAFPWESPSVVFDAPILPPAHHIRLVRIMDPMVRKLVKRAARKLFNGT
jgi:hypothetical protein